MSSKKFTGTQKNLPAALHVARSYIIYTQQHTMHLPPHTHHTHFAPGSGAHAMGQGGSNLLLTTPPYI